MSDYKAHIFVYGPYAFARVPYELRHVVKSSCGGTQRWDSRDKFWDFSPLWVNDLASNLRSAGAFVRISYEKLPEESAAEEGDWAVALFAALNPELGQKAYRALSQVLHPDAGGDGRAQQQLNDAWRAVQSEAGAR